MGTHTSEVHLFRKVVAAVVLWSRQLRHTPLGRSLNVSIRVTHIRLGESKTRCSSSQSMHPNRNEPKALRVHRFVFICSSLALLFITITLTQPIPCLKAFVPCLRLSSNFIINLLAWHLRVRNRWLFIIALACLRASRLLFGRQ